MVQSVNKLQYESRVVSGLQEGGVEDPEELRILETDYDIDGIAGAEENGRLSKLNMSSSTSVNLQITTISVALLELQGFELPEVLDSPTPEQEVALEQATTNELYYTVDGFETYGSFDDPVAEFGAGTALMVEVLEEPAEGESVAVNITLHEHSI